VSEVVAAGTAERARSLAGTAIGALYRNLADFQAVAGSEHAHLAGLAEAVAPAPGVWVPFLRSDVHDIAGMEQIARHVFARSGAARRPVRPTRPPRRPWPPRRAPPRRPRPSR